MHLCHLNVLSLLGVIPDEIISQLFGTIIEHRKYEVLTFYISTNVANSCLKNDLAMYVLASVRPRKALKIITENRFLLSAITEAVKHKRKIESFRTQCQMLVKHRNFQIKQRD